MGSRKLTKKQSRAQSEDFHEIERLDVEPGDINVFSGPQTTQASGASDEAGGDSKTVLSSGTDDANDTKSDFPLPPPLKSLAPSPRKIKSTRQKETFLGAPEVSADSFAECPSSIRK